MYNPQINWNHGTETQEEALLHRQTGIMELKHKKRHYCTDKLESCN